jgi:hypothetical protein
MMLEITSPVPWQVLQRSNFRPSEAHFSREGGAALGGARVQVSGVGAPAGATRAWLRTQATPGSDGTTADWQEATLDVRSDGTFTASAWLPAGGWFRLALRVESTEATVEPVGIGEVFVVAGQSYATSCHESTLHVADPLGRVVAAHPEVSGWRVAHDPQPDTTRIDEGTFAELMELMRELDLSFPSGEVRAFRGSLWPPVGDQLRALLRVPIAFVNVAVGGTRIAHWAHGTLLFDNLRDAVAVAGDHRAVLWQQGESDVAAGTPTEVYADALRALRRDLATASGTDRPWIVAKSTHHPGSTATAADEERIRTAVACVWTEPGFVAGPDTDTIGGMHVHRAPLDRGGHFTTTGQQLAAQLWFAALWSHLHAVGSPP